jgi:hypothetical protein
LGVWEEGAEEKKIKALPLSLTLEVHGNRAAQALIRPMTLSWFACPAAPMRTGPLIRTVNAVVTSVSPVFRALRDYVRTMAGGGEFVLSKSFKSAVIVRLTGTGIPNSVALRQMYPFR